MRACIRRSPAAVSRAAGLIALALLLIDAPFCIAALNERDVMDKITDSLSVMRHFYKDKADAQYNLDLCRASKALTEKQLAMEVALLEEEKAKVVLLEGKDLTKPDQLDVAKARADILQAQGLTQKDLKDLSEQQRAELTDLLKPGALKQEDLMAPIREKMAILQKQSLTEKDLKNLADAVRVMILDLLKPLPQEEDALLKPVQDEKAKLATFYQRGAAVEEVMFAAREAKLLAVADSGSLDEKHRVIEAEKARVREVLKRKDLEGKELLNVESGVLTFLQNMHGEEEKWPEAVEAKSQVQRVAALEKRVGKLQRQLQNLTNFDYERIYPRIIADDNAQIEKYSYDLQARLSEYEAMFGRKPQVNTDFEAEVARYHPGRQSLGYVINLN